MQQANGRSEVKAAGQSLRAKSASNNSSPNLFHTQPSLILIPRHRLMRRSALTPRTAPARHSAALHFASRPSYLFPADRRRCFPPSFPFVLLWLFVMSARKRSRAPDPAQAVTRHHNLRHRSSPPSTGRWHILLPELLLQSATLLLGPCWHYTADDIQLFLRLSSVCADWRNVVNRDGGGSRHTDFWARIGAVTVEQRERNQKFSILGIPHPVHVIPAALASLRHIRTLHLHFSTQRLAHGAAILDSLSLYTRLTTLDLNLSAVRFKPGRYVQQEAQDALDAVLAALAAPLAQPADVDRPSLPGTPSSISRHQPASPLLVRAGSSLCRRTSCY